METQSICSLKMYHIEAKEMTGDWLDAEMPLAPSLPPVWVSCGKHGDGIQEAWQGALVWGWSGGLMREWMNQMLNYSSHLVLQQHFHQTGRRKSGLAFLWVFFSFLNRKKEKCGIDIL